MVYYNFIFIFGSSLLACTFTTQLPSLKTFKQWTFRIKPAQYKKLKLNDRLDLEYSNTAIYNIHSKSIIFFVNEKKLCIFSGLLGRVGPIVVHGSINIITFRFNFWFLWWLYGTRNYSTWRNFSYSKFNKIWKFSYIPQDLSCRINNFWITYTKRIKIDQFYSDLSYLIMMVKS